MRGRSASSGARSRPFFVPTTLPAEIGSEKPEHDCLGDGARSAPRRRRVHRNTPALISLMKLGFVLSLLKESAPSAPCAAPIDSVAHFRVSQYAVPTSRSL